MEHKFRPNAVRPTRMPTRCTRAAHVNVHHQRGQVGAVRLKTHLVSLRPPFSRPQRSRNYVWFHGLAYVPWWQVRFLLGAQLFLFTQPSIGVRIAFMQKMACERLSSALLPSSCSRQPMAVP